MTSDERQWQRSCARFGTKTLPPGEDSWREYYIRMNLQVPTFPSPPPPAVLMLRARCLSAAHKIGRHRQSTPANTAFFCLPVPRARARAQEFVQKLNDSSDFKRFYELLDLSAPYVRRFEWITFNPDRIESRYYFLTQLLTRLPNLREFKVARHSFDLHPNACKGLHCPHTAACHYARPASLSSAHLPVFGCGRVGVMSSVLRSCCISVFHVFFLLACASRVACQPSRRVSSAAPTACACSTSAPPTRARLPSPNCSRASSPPPSCAPSTSP